MPNEDAPVRGTKSGNFALADLFNLMQGLPKQTPIAQTQPVKTSQLAPILAASDTPGPSVKYLPPAGGRGSTPPASVLPMPNEDLTNLGSYQNQPLPQLPYDTPDFTKLFAPANQELATQAAAQPATQARPQPVGTEKIFGMDKNKLQMITGLLANAIAPRSIGGRIGKTFGTMGAANIAAKKAAQLRQTLRAEKLADEERTYGRGAALREQQLRNAKLLEETRRKELGKLSDLDIVQKEYRGRINPETKAPYTETEILKISKGLGKAPAGTTDYERFKNDPEGYAKWKAAGRAPAAPRRLSPRDQAFANLTPEEQRRVTLRGGSGRVMTTADKKFAKEEAKETVSAAVAALGGDFDPKGMAITIPTDKKGKIDPVILRTIEDAGFKATPDEDVTKTDRPYWFTGDSYSKNIYLSDFGKKAPAQKKAATKKDRAPLTSFQK